MEVINLISSDEEDGEKDQVAGQQKSTMHLAFSSFHEHVHLFPAAPETEIPMEHVEDTVSCSVCRLDLTSEFMVRIAPSRAILASIFVPSFSLGHTYAFLFTPFLTAMQRTPFAESRTLLQVRYSPQDHNSTLNLNKPQLQDTLPHSCIKNVPEDESDNDSLPEDGFEECTW